MLSIRRLTGIGLDALNRLNSGYTSTECYCVSKSELPDRIIISLQLKHLEIPFHKRWESTQEDLERYEQVVNSGFSLGAYLNNQQVGIALAEKRDWNSSLWIWEFYVEGTYRRKGIGRQLMESLAHLAKQAGLRIMTAESQNTNAPAIAFYRALGFEIDGIDLSYYTNQDLESGEVAVFMKRKLV